MNGAIRAGGCVGARGVGVVVVRFRTDASVFFCDFVACLIRTHERAGVRACESVGATASSSFFWYLFVFCRMLACDTYCVYILSPISFSSVSRSAVGCAGFIGGIACVGCIGAFSTSLLYDATAIALVFRPHCRVTPSLPLYC